MATAEKTLATTGTGEFRAASGRKGMAVPRVFSTEGVSPYDQVDWEFRTAAIKDERGRVIFEQADCEIPKAWSQLATNVVVSKYFYGEVNTPERETSVRHLVDRVTRTIADWGREDGYFASAEAADAFHDELTALCLNQFGSFNSPVWFNVGLFHRYGIEGAANNWRWDEETRGVVKADNAYKYPQGSACFIQSVDDDMESIMRLAHSEAMLFKYGSGTGSDLSSLRSSKEKLSGGGRPSGPVSFMRVYDAVASVVKSGGKCLAPNQTVFTASGLRTVQELAEAGRDFVILSYSKRLGRVAAKMAQAFRSGRKEVVALVTDKGEFHLSADHPMMLKTGEMVPIHSLRRGMSLMATSTYAHGEGYVRVGLANGRQGEEGRDLLHRMVAADVMGLDLAGQSVHHRDGNWLDSRPENLDVMGQGAHAGFHACEVVGRGEHIFQTRRFPHDGASNGMHASSSFWADPAKSGDYRAKQAAVMAARGAAVDMQAAARRVRMLNTGYKLVNAGHDISSFEGYVEARKAAGRRCPSVPGQRTKFDREFGSYAEFYRQLRAGNHQVLDIRPLGVMDVYDIEVFDDEPDDKRPWSEHNFAISPIGQPSIFGTHVFVANTRRAAKMQTLKCWHPDILEFIECKTKEEKKAQALIRAGYEANFNGEAYSSVMFQNANLSVRATDALLRAAESGGDWTTRAVTTGRPMQTYPAGLLLDRIAEGTWLCGDPGMQYEDTIQRWHTCPNTAPINSSNPCVTGETLVSTAEGYRRIADLVGKEVLLVDRAGVRRPIQEVFPTGRKPVYRLTTRAGYQLRLTADHRVFTVNRGDVPARELTKNDRVALNPVGFGGDDLDVEIAEVIGLMLGDGCISRAKSDGEPIATLTMASDLERPIVAEVRDRLNRLKTRSEDGRGRRPIEIGEGGLATVARLATGSRAVAETFERYAVLDQGSVGKRLTEDAFGLNRAAVAGLLRGLFTADGCLYNYGAKSQSISLDSVSLDLLRQVQLLLLGFGIKAKLYTNRRVGPLTTVMPDGRGGTKEYAVLQMHSLRISRSSRLRFEKEVGFWPGSHKQAKLELLNQTVGAYQDRMDDAVDALVLDGEEEVFDLTEPATDHFGANGLVVHNCSEYMFVDDSACNLASLNLMKFRREDGTFDAPKFRAACRIFITAQELLVDHGSYPTERIAANSHKFRPLGLGYANLGSLIMASGRPYDSDEGRALAGAITAIMHGQAYLTSAEHAGHVGPFDGFALNREPMLRVMEMHRDAVESIDPSGAADLLAEARAVWDACLDAGRRHGFRNSQVTVLAPTGTIAFMMDCDTTGVEPDIALVKYKQLAGGGMLKIVNRTVPMALRTLGYDEPEIRGILDHVDARDTIEGAPGLRDEHLPVFDCAFTPRGGTRSIPPRGHLKMMAAVQPFLSGAISKTVNMPREATVADVRVAYLEGWKLGLKALAIYRDGSKESQPVTTQSEDSAKAEKDKAKEKAAAASPLPAPEAADAATSAVPAATMTAPAIAPPKPGLQPRRERLPDTRKSLTHKFDVQGHEGYLTVGFFEDGRPGEVFVTMAKEGSTIGGLMDTIGTLASMGLQYGVPLSVFVNKFAHQRFEPAGFTKNPDIPIAKSVTDYIFRWLGMEFLPGYREANAPRREPEEAPTPVAPVIKVNGHRTATMADLEHVEAVGRPQPAHALPIVQNLAVQQEQFAHFQSDAPACDNCGALTVRCGTCYRCFNCGNSMGCS